MKRVDAGKEEGGINVQERFSQGSQRYDGATIVKMETFRRKNLYENHVFEEIQKKEHTIRTSLCVPGLLSYPPAFLHSVSFL